MCILLKREFILLVDELMIRHRATRTLLPICESRCPFENPLSYHWFSGTIAHNSFGLS
jgi:hypothetical protein